MAEPYIVPPDLIRSESLTYPITVLQHTMLFSKQLKGLIDADAESSLYKLVNAKNSLLFLDSMVNNEADKELSNIVVPRSTKVLDKDSYVVLLIECFRRIRRIGFSKLGIIPAIEDHEYDMASDDDRKRRKRESARDYLRKLVGKDGKKGLDKIFEELKKEDELKENLKKLTIRDVIHPAYLGGEVSEL